MRQVNLVKTPYKIVMNMEMVLAKLLTFPGHLRTVKGGVTYVINVGQKTTIKFRMHLYNENWLVFYFFNIILCISKHYGFFGMLSVDWNMKITIFRY